MKNLIQLNQQQHSKLKVDKQLVEQVGANLRMVPVVLSEFLKLVIHYPIAMTKNEETGKFACVALLGFEQGENLFWQQNAWNAVYIPLHIQRQPFFIGQDEQTKHDEYCICYDPTSPILNQEKHGEALFLDSGDDAPYLSKVKQILAELIKGESAMDAFIHQLLKLNLLMPLSLDIKLANNENQKIRGLYTIDEEKLNTLDDEDFNNLRTQNYLSPIYSLINSLGQIYALVQKKNERQANAQKWFEPTS